MGNPDDIFPVSFYLDDSKYITGHNLVVDLRMDNNLISTYEIIL